jgi:hypothetical protein
MTKTEHSFGLTKRDAQARIDRDEYSWAELATMLRQTAKAVRVVQSESSKLAKGVPLAILFNVYRRTAEKLEGRPKGSEHEDTALALLREFGRRRVSAGKGRK